MQQNQILKLQHIYGRLDTSTDTVSWYKEDRTLFVKGFTTGNDNININSVTYTPGEWSNEAITININETDITHINALAEAPYSFDGGKTWQKENYKIYTENTNEICIKIKDINNNIASYNTAIKGIEKTKPNDAMPSAEADLYSITVTCNQQDNESGIAKVEYAIYNEEAKEWKWQDSNKFEGLKEGTSYKVKTRATDKAGNSEESQILEIATLKDNIKPEIISVKDITEKINGYAKTAKVEIKAQDNESGLKSIEIKSQDGTIDVTQALESDTITLEFTENGTYTITVYDNRDNSSESKQITINYIDSTAPEIKYDVMNNAAAKRDENNRFVSKMISKEIIVQADDKESGIEGAAYSFDGGKTWQQENTKVFTENAENVTIVVKDAVGNEKTENAFDITDFDNPLIKGVKNETWYAENVNIELIKADKAYYYYSKNETVEFGNSIEIKNVTNPISFSENGYYKIVAENNNGKSYEIRFGIDKVAPKITEIKHGDLIENNNEKGAAINISYETNSGISSLKYYDNKTWYSVSPNTKIVLMNGITTKLKAVNKAGIESEEYTYTMELSDEEIKTFSASGSIKQQQVNGSKEVNLNEVVEQQVNGITENNLIEEGKQDNQETTIESVDNLEQTSNKIKKENTANQEEKTEIVEEYTKAEEKHNYTLKDVVYIQKILVGRIEYNQVEMNYLDINNDGQINLIDLVKVLNKLVE